MRLPPEILEQVAWHLSPRDRRSLALAGHAGRAALATSDREVNRPELLSALCRSPWDLSSLAASRQLDLIERRGIERGVRIRYGASLAALPAAWMAPTRVERIAVRLDSALTMGLFVGLAVPQVLFAMFWFGIDRLIGSLPLSARGRRTLFAWAQRGDNFTDGCCEAIWAGWHRIRAPARAAARERQVARRSLSIDRLSEHFLRGE